MPGQTPPTVRGGLPWVGHMFAYGRNPYRFVSRVATTYGPVAAFKLLGQRIVLLTGDSASTAFYRSPDEQLDQSAAYQVMTPIFGAGVLYDATPDRKDQQLRMLLPPLRGEAMPEHAPKIVHEVEAATSSWEREGQFDVVTFMQKLTINTATHCLLGRELRYELNDSFVSVYHDLEQGVSPLAYYFPHLPLPKFRRRDRARRRMEELVTQIIDARRSRSQAHSDLLQTLVDMRYADGAELTPTEITGILIGAVFAGHHTSAGTAAWLLIELLRNPDLLSVVRAEIDCSGEPTAQTLRDMPTLDGALKEVLRLHPPVIILMRRVLADLVVDGYTIPAGDLVWASPPVTHRLPAFFTDPDRFDASRFDADRREDRNVMAYQPFGGGKHRCAGSGFAAFQIKAIFAMLLQRFDFELVDDAADYADNYRKMIVQPRTPSLIRYRVREPEVVTS